MANANEPGFLRAANPAASNLTEYTAGEAVAKDDIVVMSSGKVYVYDPTDKDHAEILGVAAHAAAADGDSLLVAAAPDAEWVMQCSGTYVAETYDGTTVGIEGGTGAAEIDEDSSETRMAYIVGHAPLPGSVDVGANARVRVRFVAHAKSSDTASATGSYTELLTPSVEVNGQTVDVVQIDIQLERSDGESGGDDESIFLQIVDVNGDAANPAAFTISKTSGDGATWVTAESKDTALIELSGGAASVDVTDVAGNSGETLFFIVTGVAKMAHTDLKFD